jgi:hypothetical protein
MLSSFFSHSALCGPTPFKYSIGLDNMLGEEEIDQCFKQKYNFGLHALVMTGL